MYIEITYKSFVRCYDLSRYLIKICLSNTFKFQAMQIDKFLENSFCRGSVIIWIIDIDRAYSDFWNICYKSIPNNYSNYTSTFVVSWWYVIK